MTRMEEVKLAHTLRSLQEQIDVLKQEINKSLFNINMSFTKKNECCINPNTS